MERQQRVMLNQKSDKCRLGTVIMSSALAESAILRSFCQNDIKVKVSSRVVEGSVIFPRAKLAFLLIKASNARMSTPLSSTTDESKNIKRLANMCFSTDFIAQIDKFISIHRQCFVILQAPLFTSIEFEVLLQLQIKYLNDNVDFLPAHKSEDCVEAMLTLASLQTPPKCEVLHQRYCDLMNNFLQPIPPTTLSNFN